MKFGAHLFAMSALAALSFGNAVHAASLVVNGGFEATSLTASYEMNTTNVTGWSTTGYNFLYFPGTGTTTGSYTPQYDQQVTMWGTNAAGASNGFAASSPDGGNFIAADGAFEVAPITQTINGLVPGGRYNVSFYWAAAQQSGFFGATTEQWKVSLGGVTQSTAAVSNPDRGFTGWLYQTFTYTVTSASAVLSFLAVGTPAGQPPFSLLDGVSVTAVPEPASWMTLLLGLVAVGSTVLMRRRAD